MNFQITQQLTELEWKYFGVSSPDLSSLPHLYPFGPEYLHPSPFKQFPPESRMNYIADVDTVADIQESFKIN